MEMAKACLKDGSPFGVCLIVEGKRSASSLCCRRRHRPHR
jgi:hypothetical protein